jgi:predicted metal-dependent enzyme (double-stranded beta helix superfamily)
MASDSSLDAPLTRTTLGATFDTEEFLDACRGAARETDARHAVRELVQRTMASPGDVAEALRPEMGGLTLLHQADDLTVVHVVWAPGMRIYPHDHRMWAVIGIYDGQEDNSFYRRAETDRRHLVESGGKELRTGDVLTLGDDTIHAVANPTTRLTGAIHVYGGDFVNEPRSQWGPGPMEERPHDYAVTLEQFAEANRAWLSGTG